MKGLLIAYTFYPNKLVGALRPTYWAEEITKHSDIELDVVTATETDFKNATYLPNTGSSWLSFFIKDEGLKWKKSLLHYFKTKDLTEYKFVILTGGPFLHFTLAGFFKKKGLKVILDYRDPFYNPIFGDKGIKKSLKLYLESQALKYADLVISVNKECHQLIGNEKSKFKRVVIPNGFDERKIPTHSLTNVKPESMLFVAGKFYWNPSVFLDVLQENNWTLAQAGIQSEIKHTFFKSEKYTYLGTLSQQELYEKINFSDIGVVFTLDVPFQSTTKIYDYIGLNKKILVVTQGVPHTGALQTELSQYPYYRWVGNNKQAILEAIKELSAMKVEPIDTSKFSRSHGLKLLINEIKALF